MEKQKKDGHTDIISAAGNLKMSLENKLLETWLRKVEHPVRIQRGFYLLEKC